MIKMTNALAHLRQEVIHNAKLEESERENLALQLENILLKAGIKREAKPSPKKLPAKRIRKKVSKESK